MSGSPSPSAISRKPSFNGCSPSPVGGGYQPSSFVTDSRILQQSDSFESYPHHPPPPPYCYSSTEHQTYYYSHPGFISGSSAGYVCQSPRDYFQEYGYNSPPPPGYCDGYPCGSQSCSPSSPCSGGSSEQALWGQNGSHQAADSQLGGFLRGHPSESAWAERTPRGGNESTMKRPVSSPMGDGKKRRPQQAQLLGSVTGAGIHKKERKRTQCINDAFNELRKHIPNVPSDTKLSKIKTLKFATAHITKLMEMIAEADAAASMEAASRLSPPNENTEVICPLPNNSVIMSTRMRDDPSSLMRQLDRSPKAYRNESHSPSFGGSRRKGWPEHVWANSAHCSPPNASL